MKKKISITVEDGLLTEIDRIAGPGARSAVVERAIEAYLRGLRLKEIHLRDSALLHEHAEAFNAVAFDVIDYQRSWEDPLPGES
ncbi:MAG: hypothetical protein O2992_12120 [Gemmatimonadetes bacterium]|nr:hypothetical protein [Gemmatimonadota bacterium]